MSPRFFCSTTLTPDIASAVMSTSRLTRCLASSSSYATSGVGDEPATPNVQDQRVEEPVVVRVDERHPSGDGARPRERVASQPAEATRVLGHAKVSREPLRPRRFGLLLHKAVGERAVARGEREPRLLEPRARRRRVEPDVGRVVGSEDGEGPVVARRVLRLVGQRADRDVLAQISITSTELIPRPF